MSWLTLNRIAAMLGQSREATDVAVEQLCTDTRALTAGSLFVALRGDNFDAHELLDQSQATEIAALIVERPVKHPAPQLLVSDSREALQQLAAAWRQAFEGRVVGLTGSNGKTTVKEMIAAIFAEAGSVFATRGNLNNELGVPMTLLSLRPEHDRAVIEMGANHPGEIRLLSSLARPDIALITNAGEAHLEGFGSRSGVAMAKGEIFEGLAKDGIAVINADDAFASFWMGMCSSRRIVTFGMTQEADVRVRQVQPLQFEIQEKTVDVPLALLGEHNAMNAAAATAVAIAAGIPGQQVLAGLSKVRAVRGRLCKLAGQQGASIIDDSYNANPSSVEAAIRTLAACPGKRLLVLGDLGELGEFTEAAHRKLGLTAAQAGLDGLFTLGTHTALTASAFGEAAIHAESLDALLATLEPHLDADTTVLVKGSRAARMERVVDALVVAEVRDAV